MLIATVLLIVGLLLASCKTATAPKEHATGKDSTPVNNASARTDAAIASTDNKTAQRDAQLKANIEAARDANKGNNEGPAKTVVDGELGIAQNRLKDTQADAEEAREAEKRRALVESGKATEARDAYKIANDKALTLAADLAVAKKERDEARAAELAAIDKFQKLVEQNKRDMERLIADMNRKHQEAIDEAHNQVMRDQVRSLNIAAGSCMGLAIGALGLGFAFGGIASVRVVGPIAALLGAGGLICFGLAQIVGQWWFKWAILFAVVVIVVWVAVWAYRHYKQGNLKTEAEAKAAQFQKVLGTVVPVIDKAYDSADETIKSWLQQNVFDKLSKKMNTDDKSVVHLVRAELNTPSQ